MKRIKKILVFMFFIMILMPFTFSVVHAADCSDVMNAVTELENIDSFYSNLDCENANNSQTIYQCNNLMINRSATLEKIFQYNDDKVCPSIDLSSIISSNEGKCSNEFGSKLKVVTDTVMKFFYISAPFILILFGSLDFFKIVVGSDPREAKKHRSNFIKRVIAFALLYITPFIVNTLFSFTPYSIDGTYICAEEINFSSKTSTGEVKGIYGGNNYGGSYGPSTGSKEILINGSHDSEAGKYVVIDTKYPGGVEGFSDMVVSNKVKQDADGSWSDCCAGFAQAHACGLHNGKSLTQSGLGLKHGDSSCNSISGGCSGIWNFNSDHCFNTEAEYMQYVIKNIQEGIPVMTVVRVGASKHGRHFVTIIGFKSSTKGTDANDLLFLDSWDGYIGTIGVSRQKGSASTVNKHPCQKVGGEYWASANKN